MALIDVYGLPVTILHGVHELMIWLCFGVGGCFHVYLQSQEIEQFYAPGDKSLDEVFFFPLLSNSYVQCRQVQLDPGLYKVGKGGLQMAHPDGVTFSSL